jgi:hypothetical protein
MTKREFQADLQAKRERSIEEWNAAGSREFPLGVRIGTVGDRVKLAESAGYKLPRNGDLIMRMDIHRLYVEAAYATGKSIPVSVLKDYPDLTKRGN